MEKARRAGSYELGTEQPSLSCKTSAKLVEAHDWPGGSPTLVFHHKKGSEMHICTVGAAVQMRVNRKILVVSVCFASLAAEQPVLLVLCGAAAAADHDDARI
jgi:hypothetical protein